MGVLAGKREREGMGYFVESFWESREAYSFSADGVFGGNGLFGLFLV